VPPRPKALAIIAPSVARRVVGVATRFESESNRSASMLSPSHRIAVLVRFSPHLCDGITIFLNEASHESPSPCAERFVGAATPLESERFRSSTI
jgi:hypothetical protein